MNQLSLEPTIGKKIFFTCVPALGLGLGLWIALYVAPHSPFWARVILIAGPAVAFVVALDIWERKYVFRIDSVRVRKFLRWKDAQLPRDFKVCVNREQRTVSIFDSESGETAVALSTQIIPDAADKIVEFYRPWNPELVVENA